MAGAESGKADRQDGSIYYRADAQHNRNSLFQEYKTVELTNVVELKSNYGLSELRDETSSTGGGTVTHTGAEFQLSVTNSTGDRAQLASAERGRYVPGHAAEAGVGVRAGSSMGMNQTARWGLFDDSDGFYIGQDGSGWFVGRRSGSTDTVTRSSNWNGDTLDGEGYSGLDHSITDGAIYQVDFTWYGYGTIEYKAFVATTDSYQRVVTLHRASVKGSVSVENPNLPLRAEIENTGAASSGSLFVGGRKYAIVGAYEANFRKSGVEVTDVSLSTSYRPVFSVRRKATITDGEQWESVSCKVGDVSIIAKSTNPVAVKWLTNATPSSTNWSALSGVSTGETALEAVTDSTAATGGEFLDRNLLEGGGKKQGRVTSEDVFDFDFRRRQPVTLMARGINGGSTIHVAANFREEF